MRIFIDDLRDPPDGDWVVVRNYDEAVMTVLRVGFPEFVSFDHDLGLGLSGFDFAKFLVEHDLDNGSMPDNFDYRIHSANPVGRDNIDGLLKNYLNHKKGSDNNEF